MSPRCSKLMEKIRMIFLCLPEAVYALSLTCMKITSDSSASVRSMEIVVYVRLLGIVEE